MNAVSHILLMTVKGQSKFLNHKRVIFHQALFLPKKSHKKYQLGFMEVLL